VTELVEKTEELKRLAREISLLCDEDVTLRLDVGNKHYKWQATTVDLAPAFMDED